MSKGDLPEAREAWMEAKDRFAERGVDLKLVSSPTGEGVREILGALAENLTRSRA